MIKRLFHYAEGYVHNPPDRSMQSVECCFDSVFIGAAVDRNGCLRYLAALNSPYEPRKVLQ